MYVSEVAEVAGQGNHISSDVLSFVSTGTIQFPKEPVHPKTCYEANKQRYGDTEPSLL